MSKKLILLIGAPGSGKTSDAKHIADSHPEISSYSLGELLKAEIEKHTTLGKINNDYVSKGELVPTAIVIDTLCEAVQKAPTDIVLVDGFPREANQMKILGDILINPERSDLVAVIEIRVSEEVARERVLGHKEEISAPEEEAFNTEMRIYQEAIKEIEAFYENSHLLTVINGERDQDDVIQDIDTFLQKQTELL